MKNKHIKKTKITKTTRKHSFQQTAYPKFSYYNNQNTRLTLKKEKQLKQTQKQTKT